MGREDEGRAVVSESNGEISCSVEETNRLRASLGLRPLDLGDGPNKPKEGSKEAPKDASKQREEEEQLQKSAEIQRKIQEMKKQRQVAAKVMSKKGLGESSSDEEAIVNPAVWVNRSREKQKEMAEKLARQLQEQDEAAQQQEEYSAKNLRGLKVQHDVNAFEEGETVILTLADKRVLKKDGDDVDVNDDEDELENVTMAEAEKNARAKEKAKRPRNIAIDDDEFGAGGPSSSAKPKALLSKYDDFTVDGKKIGGDDGKPRGIRIGEDMTKEQKQAAIKAKLEAAKVVTSLAVQPKEVAAFMTAEEAAAFNKPKGVKKLRRKKKERLDLEPVEAPAGEADRGSRTADRMTKRELAQLEDRAKRGEAYQRAYHKAAETSISLLEGAGGAGAGGGGGGGPGVDFSLR